MRADQVAEEGVTVVQPGVPVTYHQKTRIITLIRKPLASTEDNYHIGQTNYSVPHNGR